LLSYRQKKLWLNLILKCQKSIQVAQIGKNEKQHFSKKNVLTRFFKNFAHILPPDTILQKVT